MSDPIDATALLTQLRGMALEAGLTNPVAAPANPVAQSVDRPAASTDAAQRTDFGALVGDALRAVDTRSDTARELSVAYDQGRPDVELADVMVAAQKARVSFEALMQVRNKMVSAYRDVMNMPL